MVNLRTNPKSTTAMTPPPNPNLFDLDTLELRDAHELCKLYCEYSGRLAPFVAGELLCLKAVLEGCGLRAVLEDC
ncbi:hypothetical protein OROHE_014321 [Orobanche hederae]